jgi:hypothetical protein
MHNLRRAFSKTRNWVFLLTLMGASRYVWAQGQPVIFSATGDVPYSTSEISLLQQQFVNHNKYSPSAFLVHVGDIIAGSESCEESRYSLLANMMKGLAVPAYIVPGDNETVDCSNRAQGMGFFMKYFDNLEENFCGAPPTVRQSGRTENWAFTMNGVLFVGINLVYGGTTALEDAANWVKQHLEAKASQVRAAVIFCHYTPGSSTTFSTPFRQAAAAFGKPVLFLHGHGHSWSMVYPFPEPNILRVQVNKGGSEDPVQVTVTMDNSSPATAFVFKRNPWSGKTIVNMPPCANAGPDQEIFGSAIVNLQGQATDDGDPSGSLTTTWSKAAGPGSVTFGNASALNTTASFSAAGIYVLRLTANDGQLQNYDEVTISVDATTNGGPVISSFSPASGNVGTVVTLNGINFTGATSVLFNGIPATSFTVNSASKILVTVPPGATTGKITVNTSLGAGFSSSDFVVTGVGANVMTFLPTDDAHVVSTSATTNYGNATNLLLERNSASDMVNIYLKFNVTGLTGPVQSAKLRLKCSNGSDDGGAVFQVSNDYKNTSTPWFETGLIWNNAPAITGSALSSAGTVTDGQTVELDVTAAITGDGTYSFALTTTSSNAAAYNSNEGSTSPVLSIEMTPPAPVLPTITSFTPDNGPVGSQVTITGTGLGGTIGVTFNGSPAAFIVDSGTQVRATVPANATTGKISVANAEGTVFSTTDFTVTGTAPLTFSFTPQHDTYINSASPTATAGTSSTLRAKVGVYYTYLKFEVTGLNGTLQNAKLRLHVSDASPDGGSVHVVSNNYRSSTTPWVEKDLNWNNAPDINGAALSSTGAVSIGQWVEFDVTSAIVGNGTYSFGLKNNNSDKVYYRSKEYGAATSPQLVIESLSTAAPSITSFTPGDGPVGTEVAITGNNFLGTTAVTFNGVPATNITVESNTTLLVLVPNGATTGRIKITNASGNGSHAQDFVVTTAPVITAFTPTEGAPGTEVTITGNHFTGTTKVSFNGKAATTFYIDSATQVRAIVPSGGTIGPGKIVVTNSAGSAISANDFRVNLLFTFAPKHDAYVKSSAATTNYGTSSTLRVKVSGSETFCSYLKFDVTGVSGTLRSATLRLYVSDAGADGGAAYLVSNDYQDGSAPWTESGLLWGNAPSITGTPLSSTGAVSIGQWVEFNVTSAITGDGTYSFGLKNNNSDIVYYRSKENGTATAPQLLIQTSSGPSALSKDDATAAETETIAAAIPAEFVLQQNYPNPFNPSTQIRFGLPKESHVTIKLYTINGAEVKTLVDNHYPAGMHALTFEAKNLPSGTYFYVMQAGAVRKVRQLMLLK